MQKYSFNNNKIYGGPTDEIFGSDDGFALFLNGMGFSAGWLAMRMKMSMVMIMGMRSKTDLISLIFTQSL